MVKCLLFFVFLIVSVTISAQSNSSSIQYQHPGGKLYYHTDGFVYGFTIKEPSIFKIKPDGSEFKILCNLHGKLNSSYPGFTNLLIVENRLIATTTSQFIGADLNGANLRVSDNAPPNTRLVLHSSGQVFGSATSTIFELNLTDFTQRPIVSVELAGTEIQSFVKSPDGAFYGVIHRRVPIEGTLENNYFAHLFKFDPITEVFSIIYDFDLATTELPRSHLWFFENRIYGINRPLFSTYYSVFSITNNGTDYIYESPFPPYAYPSSIVEESDLIFGITTAPSDVSLPDLGPRLYTFFKMNKSSLAYGSLVTVPNTYDLVKISNTELFMGGHTGRLTFLDGESPTPEGHLFTLNLADEPTIVCEFPQLITSIEDKSINVSIFPNPFVSVVQITNIQHIQTISVLDFKGAVLETMQMRGLYEYTIDLTTYPSGQYYIELTDSKNIKLLVRVIKDL